MQENYSENVTITEKKEKQHVRQINHIYQPGAFTYIKYPDIDFTDEPVVKKNF